MRRALLIIACLIVLAEPAGSPAGPDPGFGPHPHSNTPGTEGLGVTDIPALTHQASLSTPAIPDPLPSAPAPNPAPPVPDDRPEPISTDEICRTIEQAAAEHALPVNFFTRLIWQESRFNQRAVSRAGAMGIAQFMPGTASWRGLADPFHPIEALQESASWLGELRQQYGNLGLAAAAYNAGPGRVQRWLAGRSSLPGETRAYVRIITGRNADEWAAPEPPDWDGPGIPTGVPCRELRSFAAAAGSRSRPARAAIPKPDWAPWGVQLAGDFSERSALSQFEKMRKKLSGILGSRRPLVFRHKSGIRTARHTVRLAENSRDAADKLCAKLRSAGGSCLVLKNPGPELLVN